MTRASILRGLRRIAKKWPADGDERARRWEQIAAGGFFFDACRDALDDPRPRFLHRVGRLLAQADVQASFDFDYLRRRDGDGDANRNPVDAARILRATQGIIAAAQVARAARFDREHVAGQVRQALTVWGSSDGQAPGSPASASWVGMNTVEQLDREFEASVAASPAAAEAWTCARLLLGRSRVVRQRSIAILHYHSGGGSVHWLHVRLHAGGQGRFFPDPEKAAFVAATKPFVESMNAAWREAQDIAPESAAQYDVSWWVESASLRYWGGASASAACCVAIVQLLRGEWLDLAGSITAQIGEGGRLKPIVGAFEKTRAALAYDDGDMRKLRYVVVHPDNFGEAKNALRGLHPENPFRVASASTVEEACRELSGISRHLQTYCRLMSDQIEAETPRWFDGRTLESVYVEPDVFRYVPQLDRLETTPESDAGSERPSPTNSEGRLGQSREADEDALYGEHQVAAERISWTRLLHELQGSLLAVRVALIAAPGQGKTSALRMLVRFFALASLKLLDRQQDFTQLNLPVRAKLKDVSNALDDPGLKSLTSMEIAERALMSVLRSQIGNYIDNPEIVDDLVKELLKQLRNGQAWLVLDGLDEAPERDEKLRRFFDVVNEWPARILISSRRYGVEGWPQLGHFEQLQLAPLTERQTRSVVLRWMRGKENLAMQFMRHPQLRRFGSNPFLLTACCRIAETTDIGRLTTRGEIMISLLGIVLKSPRRANELHACLSAVGWRMARGKSRRIHETELLDVLRLPDAESLPPDTPPIRSEQETLALRDELIHERLLVPVGTERQFEFPHPSFVEFLAACHLARCVELASWEHAEVFMEPRRPAIVRTWLARKAWDPSWDQVIQFAAGQFKAPRSLVAGLIENRPTLDNPDGDDILRHRMLLGSLCLDEVPAGRLGELEDLVMQVREQAMTLYRDIRMRDALSPKLGQALAAVTSCEKRLRVSPDLIETTLTSMRQAFDDGKHIDEQVELLLSLGQAAARSDVTGALVELLTRPWPHPRSDIIDLIGQLGSASIEAGAWDLLQSLSVERSTDKRRAILALGRLYDSSLTPLDLQKMISILREGNDRDREWALRCLYQIDTLCPNEQLRDTLLDLAENSGNHDAQWAIRILTTSAVGRSDAKVADFLRSRLMNPSTPEDLMRALRNVAFWTWIDENDEVVDYISGHCWQEDAEFRAAAAFALTSVVTNWTSGRVHLARRLLNDSEESVRLGVLGGFQLNSPPRDLNTDLAAVLSSGTRLERRIARHISLTTWPEVDAAMVAEHWSLAMNEGEHDHVVYARAVERAAAQLRSTLLAVRLISDMSTLVEGDFSYDRLGLREAAANALRKLGPKAATMPVIQSLENALLRGGLTPGVSEAHATLMRQCPATEVDDLLRWRMGWNKTTPWIKALFGSFFGCAFGFVAIGAMYFWIHLPRWTLWVSLACFLYSIGSVHIANALVSHRRRRRDLFALSTLALVRRRGKELTEAEGAALFRSVRWDFFPAQTFRELNAVGVRGFSTRGTGDWPWRFERLRIRKVEQLADVNT